MFPTPPELREEMHDIEQSSCHANYQAPVPNAHDQSLHSKQSVASNGCLCGCAERPDNSGKILKIKIFAGVFLAIVISLVGLNAYQRDTAQASNENMHEDTFQNSAGAIQAAETAFPTMVPLNDTQPNMQSYNQQAQMPMQMTPQMATPISVPVNYSIQQMPMQQTQMIYPQYSPYVANNGYQLLNCTNKVEQDLVGQRLKRFVTR